MKKTIFLVQILIVLGFCACDVTSLGDPVVIAEVEDEFELEIWENLYPESRNLTFLIKSIIELEDCSNYKVENTYFISGNKIHLSIKDIVKPSDCDPGKAPAGADAELASLAPGIYGLRIDLKSTVVNEGQVIFSEDEYSVQMYTENGIRFNRDRLRRVPEDITWGYINYSLAGDEAAAQAFLDRLGSLVEPRDVPDGYYGYFTKEGTSLTIQQQPESEKVISFMYNLTDQMAGEVKSLVTEYRTQYPGTLELFMMDSRGSIY